VDAGAVDPAERCLSCGAELRGPSSFCRHCGAARSKVSDRSAQNPREESPRSSAEPEADHSAAVPTTADAGALASTDRTDRPTDPGSQASPTDPRAPVGDPAVPPDYGSSPTIAGAPAGYPQPPQAGHGTPPSGYQAPHPGYGGPPAPGYPQPPQVAYGTPPPGYQAPQSAYGPPPPGYPGLAAGYPGDPAFLPAPTERTGERRLGSGWLIGGTAVAVLAIVGISVGIYLAVSGGSSPPTRLVATPLLPGATSPVAKTPAQASAPPARPAAAHHAPVAAKLPPSVVTPPRASISQAGEQQAVASTIQRHFSLISHHEFSAAYALLAPSLQTGESSWVSAHEADGIYSVNVAVDAAVRSSDSATASIVKMTTLDGHGCKSWSGSWGLIKISGQWRISESNLSAAGC
jgi:hypothetical protein